MEFVQAEEDGVGVQRGLVPSAEVIAGGGEFGKAFGGNFVECFYLEFAWNGCMGGGGGERAAGTYRHNRNRCRRTFSIGTCSVQSQRPRVVIGGTLEAHSDLNMSPFFVGL